jgi:hypothetical protein
MLGIVFVSLGGGKMKKIEALKEFFSVPNNPVTNGELIDFKRGDPEAFDELAELAAKALGKELS